MEDEAKRRAATVGDQLHHTLLKSVMGLDHKPDAAYVLTAAGVSALNTLTIFVGNPGTEAEHNGSLASGAVQAFTPQARLYSLFLINRVGAGTTCEVVEGGEAMGMNVCLSFGPKTLLEAMGDYEKFTGEQPDAYLDPGLVKAARMYVPEDKTTEVSRLFARTFGNGPQSIN